MQWEKDSEQNKNSQLSWDPLLKLFPSEIKGEWEKTFLWLENDEYWWNAWWKIQDDTRRWIKEREKHRQECYFSQIFKQYEAKHHRTSSKKVIKLEMLLINENIPNN